MENAKEKSYNIVKHSSLTSNQEVILFVSA